MGDSELRGHQDKNNKFTFTGKRRCENINHRIGSNVCTAIGAEYIL
jgi:hypothetical protein